MKPISSLEGERDVLRLGIVGAGAISQAVHLPAARRLGAEIDLAALYDLSPARTDHLARAFGARPARHVEEVIGAADVDAVLIATPGSHTDLVHAALDAGKHVLAEKPLALTVADTQDLRELAVKRGRVLQVGYMKMYDPAVLAAAERRTSIGRLGLLRITVLHPADAPQVAHVRVAPFDDVDLDVVAAATARECAASRRAIGDVPEPIDALYRNLFNGSLIHELSILRALGVALPTEFSHVELWPWPAQDAPPSLLASAPIEEAGRLVLSWNWLPDHPEYREEVALFGAEGRLRIDMAPPYLLEERSTVRLERVRGELREEQILHAGRDSAFVCQLERFAAATRGDEPVHASADGAVEDLRCLQALVVALGRQQGFDVGGEAAQARGGTAHGS